VYVLVLGGADIKYFITTAGFPVDARQGQPPVKREGKKIGIINYVRHISISLHLNYKDKDIYEYPLCGVKKIK